MTEFINEFKFQVQNVTKDFLRKDAKLALGPLAKELNFGKFIEQCGNDCLLMIKDVAKAS